MPFKLNQDRRHPIPRQTHKVTNWPAYEAGLRQRGSLTVWFSDEAIEAWTAEARTTRGRQPWYWFCQRSRQRSWPTRSGLGIGPPLMAGRTGMRCIECGSAAITERPERTAQGYRRFRCR